MTQVAPAHIPKDRVFEFNIYNDPRFADDLHGTLATLHRDAPDVFWTNENCGHWVVTRHDLLADVLRDHESFSASGNHPPQVTDFIPTIPLNLDPPEHTYYRKILTRHFGPSAIRKLEGRVQHWAHELIDVVAGDGRCEFMNDIGSLFPVSVFMEMMGLPLAQLREYRALVVELFSDIPSERYLELQNEITARMRQELDARKTAPRDDLLTYLQTDEVDGRRMIDAELDALTNLLFQAGMDTVANFAGFFFHYLATRPALQREIATHPDRIGDFLDEGFRLLGVVNNFRVVRRPVALGGVEMQPGDMVACMLPLAGLDAAKNPDPLRFDIDRPQRAHMLFSKGVHLCIGHTLAKMEMNILVAEWFRRIPSFGLAERFLPEFRGGSVMGIAELPLIWPAPRPN